MVKNATTAKSNLEILEGYFNKYPDVPKETILKQHMLSLGHWFSDAALDASEGALVKSYRLFSYDLVPMSYFKRNEHRRVPEHFVLLNGPYDMRPVAIQTSLSPDSPYLVDVVDGRLVLTVDGQVVSHVRIPKTPDYYFKSLPDGTPYHEIVAFGSFITIFRNCQYWGAKEECKFCDINENARQMKLSRDFTLNAPVKSVADVVTVCEHVAGDAQKIGAGQGFVLSGGSITKTLHGKSEVDFYEEYIRAIKNIADQAAHHFRSQRPAARRSAALQRRRRRPYPLQHGNLGQESLSLDQSRQGRAGRLGQLGALDGRRGGSVRQWHGPAELRLGHRNGAAPWLQDRRGSGQVDDVRLRIPDVARHFPAAAAVAPRAVHGAVQGSRAAAGAVGLLHSDDAHLVRDVPEISRQAAEVRHTQGGAPGRAQSARSGAWRLRRLCDVEGKFIPGRCPSADRPAQRAMGEHRGGAHVS